MAKFFSKMGKVLESFADILVIPNAKRHRTTMNRQTKYRTESQRFVKLKEVQANAQSQHFCTTFNFTPTNPKPINTPNDKL